jgi:hypothetical protein
MQIGRLITPIFFLLACSGHTSASDEPWFSAPGGTWVPDPAVVSNMKDAIDGELRQALAVKTGATLPPTRYWFQYLARGSGSTRMIDIV